MRLLQPLDAGLVLYLPFWEGVGIFTEDVSPFRNHGAINGASWVNGVIGKALSFDGNDYALIGHKDSLDLQEFTIALWANTTAIQRAFLANGGYARGGYHIGLSGSGRFMIEAMIGGAATGEAKYANTTNLDDGVFRFFVITLKNHVVTFYLNGVADGQGTFTGDIFYTGTSNFYVGRREYPGSEIYHIGKVDEVRVYNRALTAPEIWEEYYRGARQNY